MNRNLPNILLRITICTFVSLLYNKQILKERKADSYILNLLKYKRKNWIIYILNLAFDQLPQNLY